MTWQNQRDHPELAKSYFNQLPKSYLYYGYTTLIDVNNYAPDIVENIKNTLSDLTFIPVGSKFR